MSPSGPWPLSRETWEVSDGRLFTDHRSAIYEQSRIEAAKIATKMLAAGHSLGVAMRTTDLIAQDSYPELDGVFETTALAIPHWQCRDEPGYHPYRINSNGTVHVYGHAGSWSGSYGGDCDPREVVGYWVRTMAMHRMVRTSRRTP